MSNTFGKIFKISTFGESHGKAVGLVLEGCPAGLEIDESKILELIRLGIDKEVIPLIYKKVLPQLKNFILKNNVLLINGKRT